MFRTKEDRKDMIEPSISFPLSNSWVGIPDIPSSSIISDRKIDSIKSSITHIHSGSIPPSPLAKTISQMTPEIRVESPFKSPHVDISSNIELPPSHSPELRPSFPPESPLSRSTFPNQQLEISARKQADQPLFLSRHSQISHPALQFQYASKLADELPSRQIQEDPDQMAHGLSTLFPSQFEGKTSRKTITVGRSRKSLELLEEIRKRTEIEKGD
ncbi:hypothetical protein ADUPG1_008722 [Aduncisulcus paluster]|uniref:Uncharacterized protein n=1 Tax=Aduncisulcus paluster TaxID=2918883 RepID=A0ABQ5KVB1_9EUKA|nr:hypothetical protein ADUPG1_008722 [Aduncisulcus paluster]